MLIQRSDDQEEATRQRLMQAETLALMLLLRARRRAIPDLALLKRRLRPSLAALKHEVESGLMVLRHNAHVAGWRDMESLFGRVEPRGLAEPLTDARRAARYSENIVNFAQRAIAEHELLGKLDNRIATLAITENSRAFNETRRVIAADLSWRADLIEIWDARLDACDVCWKLDGKEAIQGHGFPGNEEPGMVHPRCRCTSHFVVRH